MAERRDASGRLTFDFNGIESGRYRKITKAVMSEFGLEPVGGKTRGLDEVFQDFMRGNEIVGLEWDNWSGYIVNAKTKSAEYLVREIAGYVSAKFNS
ncbi:hypothetical protein [Pseudomonas sp. RL_15y_Pfl2_60]|uniref:hypothetical protein n=1 Tax=Pseudomonas sp. RL_15y_Pfl2_60 TaxID=3088709 RepID=UPI0030DCB7FC